MRFVIAITFVLYEKNLEADGHVRVSYIAGVANRGAKIGTQVP